ncbi:MAG: hypothetical protein COB30_011870 [Ectothiorhodospiraceae bacterium]|nr:hypothetical protein [Ectothiorhodospiraceae bacterium]
MSDIVQPEAGDKQQTEQHKQRVTNVFNRASQDYDNVALRFFPLYGRSNG